MGNKRRYARARAQRLKSVEEPSLQSADLAQPSKVTDSSRKPLARSSLEAYASAVLGFSLARFPMNWWLQAIFLFLITLMIADVIWNSNITLHWKSKYKLLTIIVSIIAVTKIYNYLPKIVPDTVLSSQINEIKKIQDFLGGGNEAVLLERLDETDILKFNIKVDEILLSKHATQVQMDQINAFFKGGGRILDARYGGPVVENNYLYPFHAKVGQAFFTSEKYEKNKNRLHELVVSSTIPDSVRISLVDLENAVAANLSLMKDVLHDEVVDNPNNIIFNEEQASPFYDKASAAYWRKRVPLQPKAEKVLVEAGGYVERAK